MTCPVLQWVRPLLQHLRGQGARGPQAPDAADGDCTGQPFSDRSNVSRASCVLGETGVISTGSAL